MIKPTGKLHRDNMLQSGTLALATTTGALATTTGAVTTTTGALATTTIALATTPGCESVTAPVMVVKA